MLNIFHYTRAVAFFYQHLGGKGLEGIATYSLVAFSFVMPSSSWACDEAMANN